MTARVQRKTTPLADRPTGGYWTEPCRAWFGQHWQPCGNWGRDDIKAGRAASRCRETQLAAGITGSIRGLSTSSEAIVARYMDRSRKGAA